MFDNEFSPYSNSREKFINLKVYRLKEEAFIPTRNHKTDAGIDIYALEDTFLPLGETTKVATGIAMKIPEGFVGKIEGRSGMNLKGLITSGGVIDSGYAGEIGVVIMNFSNTYSPVGDKRGYLIKRGDRIAQLLTYRIDTPRIVLTHELWDSERSDKGFSSSGR